MATERYGAATVDTIEKRRNIIKYFASEYGIDIVAVDTSNKNISKSNKKIKLFKENKTRIRRQELSTEDYVKKINAGVYDGDTL
jgi:hypothetical protein